jgi:hypothetical protein
MQGQWGAASHSSEQAQQQQQRPFSADGGEANAADGTDIADWGTTEAQHEDERDGGGGDEDQEEGLEQLQQQPQWPAALMPGQQPQAAPQQPQSMHHGGSFKTYMDHKNLKLQEQFEMQALGQNPVSQLFAGVSIHVNGLTRPSHGELKQLMALHGGRFETYYHRNRVTHIVCSNLPDTKLKQLAHARWAPVVFVGCGGAI